MSLTDDGAQLLLGVFPSDVLRTPALSVGLWYGPEREVVGAGYGRLPIVAWLPARPDGAGWVARARPVVWDRVGQDGWGDIDGFFVASPTTVLSYVRFDEPILTGVGDTITVTPFLRVE